MVFLFLAAVGRVPVDVPVHAMTCLAAGAAEPVASVGGLGVPGICERLLQELNLRILFGSCLLGLFSRLPLALEILLPLFFAGTARLKVDPCLLQP